MSGTVILDPRYRVASGFNSKFHPATLPDTIWAQFRNIRLNRGIPKARGGSDRLTTNEIVTGGILRYAKEVQLNGTTYYVALVSVGGAVRIMYNTTLTGSYSEATVDGTAALDDMFGNTRMTDSGQWSMAVVAHIDGAGNSRDVLIVQNGVDDPRVWDPLATHASATNSCKVSIHKPIDAPLRDDAFAAFSWTDYMPIGAATGITLTNSAAALAGAYVGANPDGVVRFTCTAAVVAGNYARMEHSSVTNGRELVIIAESQQTDWLSRFKIIVRNSALVATTIWDGSNPAAYKASILPIDRNPLRTLYAFDMSQHLLDSLVDDFYQLDLEYVGAAPTATFTVDFLAVITTGYQKGGAQFGISFENASSRSKSPGLVLESQYKSFFKDLGASRLLYSTLPTVPLFTDLSYNVQLSFHSPTTGGADVHQLAIYRKEFGETDFRFVVMKEMYYYTAGAWAARPGYGTPGNKVQTTLVLEDVSAGLLLMPGGDHSCIPKGVDMLSINGRLFVAAVITNGTISSYNTVMISQRDRPFNFTFLNDGKPRSGTSHTFNGEQIKRFGRLIVPGASHIAFCFTDKNVWRFDGFTPDRLGSPTLHAEVGTRSPYSVVSSRFGIFFVDDSARVRAINGMDAVDLSSRQIAELEAVPAARRDDIACEFHNQRLYVAYSRTGETLNKDCLVFHAENGEWESSDLLPTSFTAEVMFRAWDSTVGRSRLVMGAGSGNCRFFEYDHDGYASDYGTSGVAITMVTNELHMGYQRSFTIDRIGVHMQKSAGHTLNLEVAYRPGGTRTSTIDLSSAYSTIWRWDDDVPPTISDVNEGPAAQITLSGTVTGGTEIYGLEAEINETDSERDTG